MRVWAVIAVSALLGGCAGSPSPLEPPTELQPIENAREIETAWRKAFGEGAGDNYLRLHPLVTGESGFIADHRGRVWAFDPQTGEVIWQTDLQQRVTSAPGLVAGRLLFGTPDGQVLALDPQTGEPLWRAEVTSEILVPPVGENGIVVVRTVDGRLFGLDARDGRRLWVYDRDVPVLTLRGTGTPVVHEGAVIAGLDNGRLAALSLRDGSVYWETTVAAPRGRSELERLTDIDGSPAIVGGVIYTVTYQGRLAAIQLSSGRVVWAREFSSYAGLAADRERVYVSDADGVVWSLDRGTGATLWRQEQLRYRALSAPALTPDGVVVGDYDGYLHWMNSEDGALKARTRVRVPEDFIVEVEPMIGDQEESRHIIASPVVRGDLLYAADRRGRLEVLRLRDEARR